MDVGIEVPFDEESPKTKGPALVFGASCAQGRSVVEGLLQSDYYPVYGACSDVSSGSAVEVSNMGAILMELSVEDSQKVEKSLIDTKAQAIFLVTKTEMPPASVSFKRAEEKECETIKGFFDSLVKVHRKDGIERHVVFSTQDIVEERADDSLEPLADGSVVAHYSGKGRGGEYGATVCKEVDGLSLTLVTCPFLHSNFKGYAIPLPNDGETEWSISVSFGNATIDMFSYRDLMYLVPNIFEDVKLYDQVNLRVSSEKLNMYDVASIFGDIFGKNVVYNPLTIKEMSALPLPSAPALAQMCAYLMNENSAHDVEVTEAAMFPRKPQLFRDWLLTNSDAKEYEEVGLAVDAEPILEVVVFNATGRQGTSVVKGLLADNRKNYTIRATTRNPNSTKAKQLQELDPRRITLVEVNLNDAVSCRKAVDGADGVFLVTDYFEGADGDPITEELHAVNVIDACEASKTVKHLVFSTLESVQEMNHHYKLGFPEIEDSKGRKSVIHSFDAKARAANYARSKKLSCTYVLMPVYTESFFDLMIPEEKIVDNKKSLTLTIPKEENLGFMCMSVDELGPCVANIFDSYQVYAGHEIGLVTDFVTIEEVAEKITNTFFEEEDSEGNKTTITIEKKDVTVEQWVEKQETAAKDLGQMFKYFSKMDAVKRRRSIAKTLELLPDVNRFEKWMEKNKYNKSFREKLGVRASLRD